MFRLTACALALGAIAGCAHTDAKQNCHLEPGWVDSSNGCMARAGYPDCYKVCPDGTRERLGAATPAPKTASPASESAH
jgi:hypothetical protein